MSHKGVRQGENLSPLLFALYVNYLEEHLLTQIVHTYNLMISGLIYICDYLYKHMLMTLLLWKRVRRGSSMFSEC